MFKKYYSGDYIKENETGETCGTCEDEEENVQGFGEVQWRKVKTWETYASGWQDTNKGNEMRGLGLN